MRRAAADAPDPPHKSGPVGGPQEPSTNWGEVRRFDDGRVIVLFERFLRCSVEEVWAAVTEPAQRAVWVPGIRFEPAPRARFDIWFGDECQGPAHASGRLEVFEPPRRLRMGSMCFDLAVADSGCLLRFSDRLWFDNRRSNAEFANAVLAGWHRFLDTLEIWLDERVSALDVEEPDYAVVDVAGRDGL